VIDIETVEWILLGVAPIFAIFTAKWAYNALAISRRKELREKREEGHDADFRVWWETVKTGGLKEVFCPMAIEEDEICYEYVYRASLYEPVQPSLPEWAEDHCVFDVPCGTPIGRHWSILDGFEAVRFVGRGSLCVTDRRLYFKGLGTDLKIDLDDLHTVAASCSGLLIGAEELDRPLLFDAVNGQKIRDILHLLIGDDDDADDLGISEDAI